MKPNAKWKLATNVLVLLALTTTQVAPAAFAQSDTRITVPAVKTAPQKLVVPQTARPPAPSVPAPRKGKGWKKWVVIAVGAGVATAFVARSKGPGPTPSIVVGPPVVERPQ